MVLAHDGRQLGQARGLSCMIAWKAAFVLARHASPACQPQQSAACCRQLQCTPKPTCQPAGHMHHAQAAQAAIDAGDYWRLRELLQGGQWTEEEGHALIFHAAVDVCSHIVLRVR